MSFLTGFLIGAMSGHEEGKFCKENENEKLKRKCKKYKKKIEQLEQQRKQAVILIKDGRFIETLNLLDPKGEK